MIPLDTPKWSWEDVQPVPGLDEADFPRTWAADGAAYIMRFEWTALRIDRVEIPTRKRTLWKRIEPSDPAGASFPAAGGLFVMTPDTRTLERSA